MSTVVPNSGQDLHEQPTASSRVLVVDDNVALRRMLAEFVMELGHTVSEAGDGPAALELIAQDPPDLILLDIEMPGMNGQQVLAVLRSDQATRDIPLIMVSGLEDIDRVAACLELGADDYFTKPFNGTLLRARIGALLERKRLRDREDELSQRVQDYNLQLEDLVAQQVRLIAAGHISTIFAMSKLAESRDPQTGLHLERMREFCRILAQHLQSLPAYSDIIDQHYIEALYAASPLHDIGKVAIPDRILLKPGRHTPEERKVMESHPVIGAETLRQVYDSHRHNELVYLGIQIAESHHEHWDGKGYPYGRSGEDIPLSARILAVADVYDALRAERVYKPSFSHAEARDFILNGSGTHFDPAVVDAFLATEAEFISVREQWDEISLTG